MRVVPRKLSKAFAPCWGGGFFFFFGTVILNASGRGTIFRMNWFFLP